MKTVNFLLLLLLETMWACSAQKPPVASRQTAATKLPRATVKRRISISAEVLRGCGVRSPATELRVDAANVHPADVNLLRSVADCFRQGALSKHRARLVGKPGLRSEDYQMVIGGAGAGAAESAESVSPLEWLLRLLAAAYVDTVKVMTFNIMHDKSDEERGIPKWKDRKQLVADTIQAELPDVVGLQEALRKDPNQVTFLTGELPEYSAVGRGREQDGGGESVSILFRKDRFDLANQGHFWLSTAPNSPGSKGGAAFGGEIDPPRMVTWVRLTRKESGKSFYVYNTHFPTITTADNVTLAQREGARLLAEQIATRAHPTEYFFITGDLNSKASEFPVRYLTGNAAYCAGQWQLVYDPAECGDGSWNPEDWESFDDIPCIKATWVELCPVPPPMTPVKTIDVGTKITGTRCSNTKSSDGKRIDYILVWDPSPGPSGGFCDSSSGLCDPPAFWDVRAVKFGPNCASDHLAVVGTFMINLGGAELL